MEYRPAVARIPCLGVRSASRRLANAFPTPADNGHVLEECTMQRSQRRLAPTFTKLTGIALLGAAGTAFAHENGVETRLKSYQEVPAVSSTATGKFKASIDEKSGSIKYELTYSGLQGDVRQAHIHFGQRSVNGGIVVFLCQTSVNPDPTGLSPTCPQSGTVSGVIQAANVIGPAGQGIDPMEFAELVAAIRSGVAYANVHSSKFAAGEIRGQLRDDD
jgi:CHRD domain